jgi:hypothetical protein
VAKMWASVALLAILGMLGSGGSAEVPAGSTARKDLAVTVYNQDFALVREIREVEIPEGIFHLQFDDVSAQIQPNSVSVVSLTAPDALTLLEQNYEYDLVNPQKLLEKYLGKEVFIARKDESGKEVLVSATLLSTDGGGVYQVGDRIELGANGRIILPSLPEGLRIRPTLLWLMESARALKHRLEVSYITRGLSWEANYVGLVNDKDTKMDVTGWVTLQNQSGTTYKDATVKLVAGEVQRVEEIPQMLRTMTTAEGKVAPLKEESFFEYHLYTLDRRTTLRDRETKQITMFSVPGVSVTKKYIVWGQRYYYYNYANTEKQKLPVGVYLEFENSRKNGLGLALPKGVFRLYKKDASGAEQFIGEDRIEHTPKDETVRVKVGNAFDIVAERVQTDYRVVSGYHEYAFSVEFRNHKAEPVVIEALEPTWGDWKVITSSHLPEKVSAWLVRFKVPVEPEAKAVLEYRVRVRYY